MVRLMSRSLLLLYVIRASDPCIRQEQVRIRGEAMAQCNVKSFEIRTVHGIFGPSPTFAVPLPTHWPTSSPPQV
ncbi:hypothetical protein F5Y19DRAFT_424678 [Xylariaceae sp. FL1651]|nr:hypothetical protein F5Y19DRAFT_424678 [Xylariaceae sp. FL1651]